MSIVEGEDNGSRRERATIVESIEELVVGNGVISVRLYRVHLLAEERWNHRQALIKHVVGGCIGDGMIHQDRYLNGPIDRMQRRQDGRLQVCGSPFQDKPACGGALRDERQALESLVGAEVLRWRLGPLLCSESRVKLERKRNFYDLVVLDHGFGIGPVSEHGHLPLGN